MYVCMYVCMYVRMYVCAHGDRERECLDKLKYILATSVWIFEVQLQLGLM